MSAQVRVLIAALGGEGGGVLATWIADAAIADGYIAQRTSVPGVAQRTGSTTYYIEFAKTDGRKPVLALSPAPGQVDLFIASELLEATRQVQTGLVTAQRTFVIAPTHRVYTIHEKIAMADGRADVAKMLAVITRFSRARNVGDFAALAQRTGCQLNAILLGLAARQLPISSDAFRRAIRADGRAVEANLRGFEEGFKCADAPVVQTHPATDLQAAQNGVSTIPDSLAAEVNRLPEASRVFAREGVARVLDFQDARYAGLYLDRLHRFAALDGSSGDFMKELARHLAVRMTSEDVIRVAQLKLRASRLARVYTEARSKPGDLVEITEFLKPGPAEILSILPAGLARKLLQFVDRRGWSSVSFPMKVRTTSLWGFLRLRALTSLRFLRPVSLRGAEERAWVERWLHLVERVLMVDPGAAIEVVQTAQLVRGYGETWERGHLNWRCIADDLIEPMLQLSPTPSHFADAVLQARIAANSDPDCSLLQAVLQSVHKSAVA
ncbi:MAG: indolepyruvate oxidoreductase subunit beta family protein [Beijerinckiaceae bacterium]|nr:indolepyruvate oxidoreductase subunit beta family protein [Beijerinckiaceae bacterium]